jgi:Tfp pilus assembly protein FimT
MGVAVGVTVAVLAFMAVMATANEHSQQQKKRPHSQAHAEEKIPNAQ